MRLYAVVLLVGCAPALQVSRPYPAPVGQDLLEVVRRRQAELRALNLETRTTSWLGGERFRASVLMLVERSGWLRFEAEVTLQGTVAALVTDGKSFSFLDYQHHAFKTGPACAANAAWLINIPLLPREIAAVILGDAPVSDEMRPLGVTWDPRAGADVLELGAPRPEADGDRDATRHLWVSLRRAKSGAGYDVVAVSGQASGATAPWRVVYEDFELVRGFSLPKVIRFAEPGRSFDEGVEIKIKGDRIVNATPAPAAFVLQAPTGVSVEAVPCRN